MPRVKILYVIGTLEIGGTEGQLVELVTRLDPQRFCPVVCCLLAGGPLAQALEARGIKVEVIGFRGLWRSTGLSFVRRIPSLLSELVRFVRFIRAEAPDILHGFLFWAYILGTFGAWVARVPVILASRRSLGHFKANKSHYLFLERIANRMTDMVIANSEAVRQDAVHQEGLPIDKIAVIHNGLEASRFDIPPNDELRRFLNFQKGAPVVGVIANFIYYKGHQFFLDAWASVVEKFPEAVVLLVGDGPLRQEFEGKVDAMGLKESVRFLGTRQDVPELLAIMNVVVHPSLEEGFSNTILEAMAAGKPVLATDMGGNPEAVVQGETGLLVPPRDSRALADAIIWMLDHPDEAARFGEAGRHRVAEHFEISRMVRQYEELYENLVAERCPGYK